MRQSVVMIKTCRMCGLNAEHYNSVPTGCKECWKTHVRASREKNAVYYREYDRKRSKTAKRKASYADKQRSKRKAMGPVYMAAHSALIRAVKKGTVIRPDHCTRCLINCSPQGHHDDYSKALDVMWLCPVCHAARHKELGKLNAQPTKATK